MGPVSPPPPPPPPLIRPWMIWVFVTQTVTVLKFLTLSSKMLVSRAGIHKMHDRIANREDPDQTTSSEAV